MSEERGAEIKVTSEKAKVKLKRRLEDVSQAIKERRASSSKTKAGSARLKAAATAFVNRSRKSGLLSQIARR